MPTSTCRRIGATHSRVRILEHKTTLWQWMQLKTVLMSKADNQSQPTLLNVFTLCIFTVYGIFLFRKLCVSMTGGPSSGGKSTTTGFISNDQMYSVHKLAVLRLAAFQTFHTGPICIFFLLCNVYLTGQYLPTVMHMVQASGHLVGKYLDTVYHLLYNTPALTS